MKPTMLDRWAEIVEERSAIEEFLNWLPGAGHESPGFHSGKQAALDVYFGIDRARLEAERQEVLGQVRAKQKETPAGETGRPG